MALNDLTNQNIQDTYQKVVQTDGTNLADGTGSLLPIKFNKSKQSVEGLKISHESIGEAEIGTSFMVGPGLHVEGHIIATGDIIAHQYIVSSSVINVTTQQLSGSTEFGNSADDTHDFIGHITASGDISSSGTIYGHNLDIRKDTNASAEIGKAHVGYIGHSNFAGFSHVGQNGINTYSLLQSAYGETYLNSKSGLSLYFRINNANVGEFTPQGEFHALNGIDATGEITASGNIRADGYITATHITASGNISGSAAGTVSAGSGSFHYLKGDTTKATGLFIDGEITASGNISSSGNLISDDLQLGGDITAVTNINLSNDLILNNNSQIRSTNESNTNITLYNDDYWKFNANNAYVAAFSSNGATFNENGAANCNFRVESDNDQYALYIDAGDNTIELGRSSNTHVTASGNISASGDLSITGHITASGNISASGDVNANSLSSDGNYAAIWNGSTMVFGTYQQPASIRSSQLELNQGNLTLTHATNGHITASGDISASGDLYASHTILSPRGIDVNGSGGGMVVGSSFIVGAGLQVAGNISASGDINANSLSLKGPITTHITASGNISSSGHISASGGAGAGFVVRPNLYWYANCDAVTFTEALDGDFPSTNTAIASFGESFNSNAAIYSFSEATDALTITRAGLYKFTYNVTLEVKTASNRTEGAGAIVRTPEGGAPALIDGSVVHTYNRFVTDTPGISRTTGTATVLINVAVNDAFKILFVRHESTSSSTKLQTVPRATSWYVEAVT
jgi:cytoskeletal protein CcmA (bactofilin family)